jgi:hypothetical protein
VWPLLSSLVPLLSLSTLPRAFHTPNRRNKTRSLVSPNSFATETPIVPDTWNCRQILEYSAALFSNFAWNRIWITRIILKKANIF